MATSFMGKYLLADLGAGTATSFTIPEDMRAELVGGKGIGAKLLYDLVPKGADPLGPDNVVMFMAGALTGTGAPAMRGCAMAKSPLTGTFCDSYFGGHFSPEIKYAGYDGIVIKGRSEKPVYLWVDDERVEFRDASELWGQDALSANLEIKDELGDASVKVASIGPAGENLVRYALVSCEYNRQAGRGGIGAVMGSKNLKAVALRGSFPVKVADFERFQKAIAKARSELTEEAVGSFTRDGTAGAVAFSNAVGYLPTRNFQDGVFEKADRIGEKDQREKLWLRDLACAGCPVRCGKMGKVKRGRYKGTVSDAVEYELLGLLGSNLGVGDIGAVTKMAELCDRLGLDGISAGAALGFAMEAFEKGVVTQDDTGGLELAFGNEQAAIAMLEKIARRDGELASLLGEGVKRASEKLGRGSEEYAVHVKGQECPAWGVRGTPAMGLAQATSDRGACHQRAWPIAIELGGKWQGDKFDKLGTEMKAEIVTHLQNYLAGLDTLVKCDFAQWGIQGDTYRELLAAGAGIELSEAELLELGERVWSLGRLFNLREGFTRADDTLPRRFMEEPLPSGPSKGHRIGADDLNKMLDRYYELRGWDGEGRPTAETLERLGLALIVETPIIKKED